MWKNQDQLDSPKFALTIMDMLPNEIVEGRLQWIAGMTESIGSMGFVNVKCVTNEVERFDSIVEAVEQIGLRPILECDDSVILSEVAERHRDHAPMLIMGPGSFNPSVCSTGLAMAATGSNETEILERYVGILAEGGFPLIDWRTVGLKDCFETISLIKRTHPEMHVMHRGESGEMALAISTTAVMRGASLVVLDDLDQGSCEILDKVIQNLSDVFR